MISQSITIDNILDLGISLPSTPSLSLSLFPSPSEPMYSFLELKHQTVSISMNMSF